MEILHLKLYTEHLEEQEEFYSDLLGFPCIHKDSQRLAYKVGNSKLEFQQRKNATPYHFAITIPDNKIGEALQWLKSRTEILPFQGKDLVDFHNWNAEAMYFYDSDKNIVEFIARKNLNKRVNTPFNSRELLEISEVGLAGDDIEVMYREIHENTGISIYDGNFQRFCAIGDEQGLFICINKTEKNWFPTGDNAEASDFELIFREGNKGYKLIYEGENLDLTELN